MFVLRSVFGGWTVPQLAGCMAKLQLVLAVYVWTSPEPWRSIQEAQLQQVHSAAEYALCCIILVVFACMHAAALYVGAAAATAHYAR